jgi:hypothetical protein
MSVNLVDERQRQEGWFVKSFENKVDFLLM